MLVYAWKNNPKRETLYGRECTVVAKSKRLNSMMIEFADNGQRENVSQFAVKEVVKTMAEPRRSYRDTTPKSTTPERESSPPVSSRDDEAPARPARTFPKQNTGRGGPQDGEYKIVTGLFPSKSGKADTVFLTPEILDALAEMKEGDTLGVSVGKKSQRLCLWYISKS